MTCSTCRGRTAPTGSANDFRFTGEQYDEALERYYLRAGYYEPETGRFSRVDPWNGNIAKPDSLHKYIYAANSPVNNIDPTGLFTLGQAVMTGAIIGIALSTGLYYIYSAITGASAAASWATASANASGPGWALGKLFEDWYYKFYGVGEKCAQVVIKKFVFSSNPPQEIFIALKELGISVEWILK